MSDTIMTQCSQPALSSFKVALIQLNPRLLDPEFNYAAAEQHIREAAAQGARLAVLPEYSLTGWAPEDSRFAVIAKAANLYISRYKALARELKINIVPGAIVQSQDARGSETGSSPKSTLLNIASFISETGELLGSYTKTNLWHPERQYLTSGPAAQRHTSPATPHHIIIETPLGLVGLLVCYDLFFPEAFRALVRAGARIIIVPTFTKANDMSAEALAYNANGEALFIQSAVVTRAFENTCCIVFCNVGGPAEEGYVGLSQVAMPVIGKLAGSFEDARPGMRIVDVDMSVLEVAERNYLIRKDLGTQGFHYTH